MISSIPPPSVWKEGEDLKVEKPVTKESDSAAQAKAAKHELALKAKNTRKANPKWIPRILYHMV